MSHHGQPPPAKKDHPTDEKDESPRAPTVDPSSKSREAPRAVHPGAVSMNAQSAALLDERIARKQAQVQVLQSTIKSSTQMARPASRDRHYETLSADRLAKEAAAGTAVRAAMPGAVAATVAATVRPRHSNEESKDRPGSRAGTPGAVAAAALDERLSQKMGRTEHSAHKGAAFADDQLSGRPQTLAPGMVSMDAKSAAILDERIALKRAQIDAPQPKSSTAELRGSQHGASTDKMAKNAAARNADEQATVPGVVHAKMAHPGLADHSDQPPEGPVVGSADNHVTMSQFELDILAKGRGSSELTMMPASTPSMESKAEAHHLQNLHVTGKTFDTAASVKDSSKPVIISEENGQLSSQLELDLLAKTQAVSEQDLAFTPTKYTSNPTHKSDGDVEASPKMSTKRMIDAEEEPEFACSETGKLFVPDDGNELADLDIDKGEEISTERIAEDAIPGSNVLGGGHDDLEFGVVNHDVEDMNLVVARPVDEENQADVYLPSAVQFDPDAKPALYRRRRRRLYVYCCMLATAIIGVCIAVGVFVFGKQNEDQFLEPTPAPTSYRESIGIQEMIQSVVGTDPFVDETSPYSLALKWLLFDDPMMLTPANKTLYQRYFAAYLYLATSRDKPWPSCAPPSGNETASCALVAFTASDKADRSNLDTLSQPIISLRWMSDVSECYWAGVTCDSQHQIRSIHLLGLNMTGTFPEGLQFFPYLQHFFAFQGNLRGSIPSEIASMKNLNELGLRTNQLSGKIPKELWSMPSLHVLNLGENQFTGSFPTEIASFVDLKSSIIHNNAFSSGTIPTEIGLMKSVFFIYWDANRLGGTIPTEIGHLTALYRLGLSENELSGTIPTEMGLVELQSEWFDLNRNRLRGPIPTEIFSLPLLSRIQFQDNQLTGTLSTWIGNMSSLREINVQNNNLTGTIPTELGNPHFSEVIRGVILNGNKFTGTMPKSICALRSSFFTELVADCLPDLLTGLAQVACPASCCSLCCDSSSTTCGASP